MAYNYEYPHYGCAEYNNDWLIAEVKKLDEAVDKLKSDIGDMESKIDKNSADIATLLSDTEAIRQNILTIQSSIDVLSPKVDTNTNDIADLEDKVTALEDKVTALEQKPGAEIKYITITASGTTPNNIASNNTAIITNLTVSFDMPTGWEFIPSSSGVNYVLSTTTISPLSGGNPLFSFITFTVVPPLGTAQAAARCTGIGANTPAGALISGSVLVPIRPKT